MALKRILSEPITGCPIFAQVEAFTKEGESIAMKSIVYGVSDPDEILLKQLGLTAKSKAHTVKVKILKQWTKIKD
jgi:hypothetical protein